MCRQACNIFPELELTLSTSHCSYTRLLVSYTRSGNLSGSCPPEDYCKYRAMQVSPQEDICCWKMRITQDNRRRWDCESVVHLRRWLLLSPLIQHICLKAVKVAAPLILRRRVLLLPKEFDCGEALNAKLLHQISTSNQRYFHDILNNSSAQYLFLCSNCSVPQ